jgi:Xaa-Pro aminopeptidase
VAAPSTTALAQRHDRIRESLETLSLDALIVTPPSNIRYLSNHAGSAGILVITREAVHLLVDFRYHEAVRALQGSPSACPGFQLWDVPASYEEALISCLADIGVTTVGFEAAHVTVARYEWWRETIAGRGLDITLRTTERIVEQARLIKDAFEVATLREAAARLDTVMPQVLAAVRAGEREREIAAVIEMAMREAGLRADSVRHDRRVRSSFGHAALPRRYPRTHVGRPRRAGLWRRLGRILLRLDPHRVDWSALARGAARIRCSPRRAGGGRGRGEAWHRRIGSGCGGA